MSEIKTNKLTGTSTAGNITVTSEGGAATMQLQQGLCKTWCSMNASTGSPSFEDGLNVASITDHNTGQFTYSYTNAMSNGTYAVSGSARRTSGSNPIFGLDDTSPPARTTSGVRVGLNDQANSGADKAENSLIVIGDLA